MAENKIIITHENEFLRPYIERAAGKSALSNYVLISSTDIYQPDSEKRIDEEGEIDSTSPWVKIEQTFQNEHPEGIILRAAPIVGTGMTGKIRRLAEEIYKARFFHFPGNEARKSVVHATDVARAATFLATTELPGSLKTVLNITDGVDPSLHDIAEALAFRMCNKRISTLSTKPQQKIGRFLYGKRYAYYTTDELFDSTALRKILPFEPAAICEYLGTHVYDETSL